MDNNEIKVSVVVPIYNASDYLRPALDSVLQQTLSDIEIICVDDGSTDSSLDIIKEYLERDSRIRIITETNAGPAHARNNGMRRARGEYIAFLDADDFLEPTFLESLYEIAKRDNLDIAISRYDVYNTKKSTFELTSEAEYSAIFADGKVSSKSEYPDEILMSTIGSAWNKLFRRSFVENMGLQFLADVRMYEDVYFVVTAMSVAERVGKAAEVLMHHRIHSSQSRKKFFGKYYTQVPLVYLKIKEFLMSHGMYAPLSVSFLNLAASRSYKMYNLLPKDSKEKFWNMYHEQYAEQLGFAEREVSDFFDADVCEFVLNVQMYSHNEYLKRLSRGAKANLQNMPQNVDMAKKRKRIRNFFRNLFGKK